MKRRGEGEKGSEHPNKQRHLLSTLFELSNDDRAMQEFVSSFEPIFRKVVKEEVDSSLDRFVRNSHSQLSGSRTLQLQFPDNLPCTLYTGNQVVSNSGKPIKIVLYDSISREIVTSGPLSSIKVHIVALNSEFVPDDRENWTKEEFEEKVIGSREGKRPLVTGGLMVMLRNGIGYVGDVSFTDNSSWMRSGKFRLGAKVQTNSDDIREGMSNSFRVKDHRGESSQKHHPPSLDDEVWRLKKIRKEGPSHRKLTQHGISNVREVLRCYFKDQSTLRAMLNISSRKNWDAIIGHALTCTLDDKKYVYKTTPGTGLLFNSIYKDIGVTFDGETYQSVDNLNIHQKRMVEDLKQIAFRNINDWVLVSHPSSVGYPMLLGSAAADSFNYTDSCLQDNHFNQQDQLEMQMNIDHPSMSPLYNCEVEQNSSSFEIGESSRPAQGFDFVPTFNDNFGMNDSSDHGLYIVGGRTWPDLPVDDFQVESSLWQGGNHEIGMSSSFFNSGIINPRNGSPKTKWYKVLSVVKWRILVKRNVAARKNGKVF